MKLDEKLVHLRKEKGLTQLELAEAVNVSRQAVSKWESGGGMPSTENLRGLSELYGVPVDYLLNDLDDIVHEEEKLDPFPLEPGDQDTPKVSRKNTKVAFWCGFWQCWWYLLEWLLLSKIKRVFAWKM